MSAPNTVARQFSESLGSEAGDAMVDWMNGVEDNAREVRADIAELRQVMDVRFADLRLEMNTRFAEMHGEMRAGFASVDAKFAAMDATSETKFAAVDGRFAAMDAKFATMDARFAEMDAAAAKRHADFMKWTMGFWAVSLVTLVGAIAAFARLLP